MLLTKHIARAALTPDEQLARSLQLLQGLSNTLILHRAGVVQFVDPLFGKRLPDLFDGTYFGRIAQTALDGLCAHSNTPRERVNLPMPVHDDVPASVTLREIIAALG